MGSTSNTYLLYHIVFSTKSRAPLLAEAIRQNVYAYMGGIINTLGGHPILINGMADHVHILTVLPKHLSVSDCLHKIKGASSHWFNQEYHMHYPKLNWQDGYSAFTVSGSELDKVKKYILNQDEHHRKMNYSDEMLLFEEKLQELTRWLKPPEMVDKT